MLETRVVLFLLSHNRLSVRNKRWSLSPQLSTERTTGVAHVTIVHDCHGDGAWVWRGDWTVGCSRLHVTDPIPACLLLQGARFSPQTWSQKLGELHLSFVQMTPLLCSGLCLRQLWSSPPEASTSCESVLASCLSLRNEEETFPDHSWTPATSHAHA